MLKQPNVILLDIENTPMTAYTWTAWEASALKILEFSKLLSVAWKELNKDSVSCKAVCDYKGYKKGVINDEKLVREIWHVLDKADIVIAHHGDAFDLKKLNARFVYYGLTAPSPFKSVDTKKVASKYFRFDSNSLNNLGAYLNLGEKKDTGGFSLWDKCMQGDKESWQKMKDYNVQDVLLLEKVYLTLRPYINNHPHLGLLAGENSLSCPTCQSASVTKRGFSVTKTGKKQRYQCTECGSWSMGKFEKVKNLLVTE